MAACVGLSYQWGGGGITYHACALVGDYLYGCSQDGNLLKIWDVSDPTAPVATGSVGLTVPNCIAIYQGLAFVGATNGNLYIVNVDDPAAPAVEATTSLAGQNWSFIRVVGGLIFLSGESSTAVGVFDTAGKLVTQFAPPARTGGLDIEGRRVHFGDATGTPASLYNYRIGGFQCGFIATGSLLADEMTAEVVHARNGEFKGDLRAWNLVVGGAATETSSGMVAAPNFFSLNGTYLDSGAGDPTGVVTLPDGLQAGFWFRNDGAAGSAVYYTTDGGTTWAAIA